LADNPIRKMLAAPINSLASWRNALNTRGLASQTAATEIPNSSAAAGGLSSGDAFVAAAAGYGHPEARLWGCLIREVTPQEQPMEEACAGLSRHSRLLHRDADFHDQRGGGECG
jgi:hypothetical protein